MPVYLKLFHGRNTPTEELDDWGFDGPVLGPLAHVHTTYGSDIKLGDVEGELIGVLHTVNDLVYYNKAYYGDWSVFGPENLSADMMSRWAQYSESAAEPPGTVHDGDWRIIPTRMEE